MKQFITAAFVLFISVQNTLCWDQGGVLLRDVQVLTLYKDRYTAARRSSPIPQLKCVGGSAGCHAFIPDVVQCQNKGWDGVDVQWECKTDMDAAFRFGRLEVSCEGFSHPDDAFILPGSCGLEFTVELTAEGRRTSGRSSGGFKGFEDLGGFASSFFSGFQGNKHQQNHQHHQGGQSSGREDSSGLLVPAVLLVLAFIVYKLFLSGNTAQAEQQGGYHDNQQGFNTGPPPPGFKPDFTGAPGGNPSYGFHSDYTQGPHYPGGRAAPAGTGGGIGGGGFWSGMGTGGLLGYLFGNQRNRPNNYNYPTYNHSRAPPAGPSSSSSGTRTASGFGGTKRR